MAGETGSSKHDKLVHELLSRKALLVHSFGPGINIEGSDFNAYIGNRELVKLFVDFMGEEKTTRRSILKLAYLRDILFEFSLGALQLSSDGTLEHTPFGLFTKSVSSWLAGYCRYYEYVRGVLTTKTFGVGERGEDDEKAFDAAMLSFLQSYKIVERYEQLFLNDATDKDEKRIRANYVNAIKGLHACRCEILDSMELVRMPDNAKDVPTYISYLKDALNVDNELVEVCVFVHVCIHCYVFLCFLCVLSYVFPLCQALIKAWSKVVTNRTNRLDAARQQYGTGANTSDDLSLADSELGKLAGSVISAMSVYDPPFLLLALAACKRCVVVLTAHGGVVFTTGCNDCKGHWRRCCVQYSK